MFANDLSMLIHQAIKNPYDTTTIDEIIKVLRDKADAMERAQSAAPR